MNRFRIGPESAAAGLAEEGAGFAFYTLAFAAGGEGQQKDEEDRKCQFALTNKSFRGKMKVFRGKTAGNEF